MKDIECLSCGRKFKVGAEIFTEFETIKEGNSKMCMNCLDKTILWANHEMRKGSVRYE